MEVNTRYPKKIKICHGIFIFKNGDKYRGQFVDNMRYGEGVYTFSNGDILEMYKK